MLSAYKDIVDSPFCVLIELPLVLVPPTLRTDCVEDMMLRRMNEKQLKVTLQSLFQRISFIQ